MTEPNLTSADGGAGGRAAPVTEYTPESPLRRPAALWREMRGDLAAARELAWRLFVRNVRARYRQSLLGYVWVFLPPAAGTLLFAFLRHAGVIRVADTGVPYVLFLVTGLVLWQTFAESLLAPLRMVAQSRELLVKVNFPREALVLAGGAEVLLTFLVRSLLLLAVLAWYGILPPLQALLFPAGVLILVMMGTAIGVALVPAGILYQDVEQGLGLFLPFWMLLTPVLYPAPLSWPASLTVTLNPAAPVIDTARAWLLGGIPAHVPEMAIVSAGGLALLLFAWVVYHVAFPILVERMTG
jgi:lipopolysaccharide transport system permease protein